MNARLLIDELSRDEWTAHGDSFLDNNLYQTWDYGDVHSFGSNRRVSRAIWIEGGSAIAMAQLRVKSLPIAGIGVAEVNWGPLWRSKGKPSQPGLLAQFLELLRNEYCGNQGLDLRLEFRPPFSNLQEGEQPGPTLWDGFAPNQSLRPYRTSVLDLEQGAEKLRASLNGKWRNCLNQAERAGLEAECGSSIDHFQRFERLYEEMWQQKKFSTGVRMEAIRAFQKIAPDATRLSVWIVKDQGTDVAAGVFSGLGDTVLYFLGASSPNARKNSNPGYLLQWLNIRRSMELGFRYYDLGGLTDSPDSGVDLFKNRMGGTRIVFPGWFEAGAKFWSLKTYSFLEKGFRAARAFAQRG